MIPFRYSAGHLKARRLSTAMTILGIAVVIAITVSMIALYHGVIEQLVASGSPDLLLVMRDGVDAELSSQVDKDAFDVIRSLPGIAKDSGGQPLVVPQYVSVFKLLRKETLKKSAVTMRGLTPSILTIRPNVRIIDGRMFTPGLNEVIVSRRIRDRFMDAEVGDTLQFGPQAWKVVGVFDGGDSALDSEMWCDVNALTRSKKRDYFSSVLVKPVDRNALEVLANTMRDDLRLKLQAKSERQYYAEQTIAFGPIRKLVQLVTFFMVGAAIFGTMNTMFSAVAARGRELATLRALGFRRRTVLVSILIESAVIALVGGVAGVLFSLPVNFISTGTFNGRTMSEVAFNFRVDQAVAAIGLAIALGAGIVGGLLPAIKAALMPITRALREI